VTAHLGDPAVLDRDELATRDVEAPGAVLGGRVLDGDHVPLPDGDVDARKSSRIASRPSWRPAMRLRPLQHPDRVRRETVESRLGVALGEGLVEAPHDLDARVVRAHGAIYSRPDRPAAESLKDLAAEPPGSWFRDDF
jgi:hypothetical protein